MRATLRRLPSIVVLAILLASATFTVSTRAQTSYTSIPVGTYPVAAAYDPSSGQVFVVNSPPCANCTGGPNGTGKPPASSITVISDSTDTAIATLLLPKSSNSIVYDSANDELFMTGGYSSVDVISLPQYKAVGGFPGQAIVEDLAYDSGKGVVYIACVCFGVPGVPGGVSPALVAMSGVNASPTAVTLFGSPSLQNQPSVQLAYDSGKGEVFLLSQGGGPPGDQHPGNITVYSDTVVNTHNNLLATIPFETQLIGMTYDSGKGEVFVTALGEGGNSTIFVISDATNRVVAQIPFAEGDLQHPGGPDSSGIHGVAYDSKKGEVFVAYLMTQNCNQSGCQTQPGVSVISDTNNSIVADIPIGTTTDASPSSQPPPLVLAYDSDKSEMFVLDSGTNTAYVMPDSASSAYTTLSTTSQGSAGQGTTSSSSAPPVITIGKNPQAAAASSPLAIPLLVLTIILYFPFPLFIPAVIALVTAGVMFRRRRRHRQAMTQAE